ncbi:unnamed protein product [Allacma fusca]|uniref:Ig-like domain-containing protein n=1 Tax=Allacma fusca TaxID=39272 RepID=A0A8J2PKR1_9HEXA|nr:unnamed protein product [Allacma fusca]
MYKFWILALTLSGLAHWASCQQKPASVPQPVVAAKINSPASLTCLSYKQPLTMCLWEKKVETGQQRQAIQIVKGKDTDGQPTSLQGFSYVGGGLDLGECGLRIDNVAEGDNNVWSCTLFAPSGELFLGTVDVTILRKPDPPQFATDLGRLNDEDEKTITCYSKNGQPPPTFQWFIDDIPIESDELSPLGNQTVDGEPATFQKLTRKFTWNDSGKKLRCVAVSEALSASDVNETSTVIVVDYSPRAAHQQVHFHVPELGTQAVVSFNISANPAPRISWLIDGVPVSGGYKTADNRIEVKQPKPVDRELYQCDLVIDAVEESDLGKVFKLTATNQIGSTSFEVHVSSNAEPSTTLGAGPIVALVLGIPLILIFIALVVVYARAKGLLCFKDGEDSHSTAHIEGPPSDHGDRGNENPAGDHEGYPPVSQTPPLTKTNGNHAPPPAPTIPPPNDDDNTMYNYNIINGRSVKDRDDGTSSEKERMGDDADSNKGGGEEKPTFSSRLSALYENLLAKKKDKTAPIDEEANKDKEKDTQVVNDEKKPDDIVYAELDLAREGIEGRVQPVVVRGSDDKTEYAEIVGVVPPAQVKDDKKSPSGSKNPSPKH